MEPVVKPSTSFTSLKAALEAIEAREKYRAVTRSPSDGEEIRWYFSKAPLSLKDQAASRPTTEVVGKSDFLRFSVNDSLALEAAFLKQEEELVSAWWKEFADCSEGPMVKEPIQPSKPEDLKSEIVNGTSNQYNDIDLYQNDEMLGVPVKGGLYEVDLLKRRCYPVYWNGNHRRVLRGHWFAQRAGLDWLPLREDVSEQLEFAYRSRIWHRRTFQPSGKFAARVNLQSSIEGLHALFTGEDDTWEAWLDVDSSGISSVLSFRSNKVKLRRGFAPSQAPQPTQDELQQRKEEEMDDYCSQVPVRHLVFMVHGIGQRLENANLIDDVGTFRHTATLLSEQHLTAYQRNRQRVLFIPCQWRRGLKLGGEEAVESCTLEGVRALRTMLSATVHDVLYYMSPVYCQDIIDSVSVRLNMLYRKFIKRNPGYNGKVSIYGHSLGSVLSYDILCHQKNLTSSFPISQINQNMEVNDANRNLGAENANQNFGVEDTQVRLQQEVAHLKEKIALLQKPRLSNHNVVSEDEFSSESDDRTKDHQYAHVCADADATDAVMHNTDNGALEVNGSAKGKENFGLDRKDRLKKKSSSRKRYTPYIEYTKLDFEVDTFFAVGSPLGVFLSLRNVRLGTGQGKDYWQDEGIEEEMPSCKRMFNIFHPFDPVAYRLEPLICKEYLNLQPEFVPYHKGGRRLHIGMQELSKDFSARSKAFVHSISVVGDRVVKALSGQKGFINICHRNSLAAFMYKHAVLISSVKIDDGKQDTEVPKETTYGTKVIEKLTGDPDGRVDYMLQDATFEHQYLQAISSHTSYWQDPDTALFIIRHLYHDIPEEDPALKNNMMIEGIENSNITTEPTPLSDQIDEDVALTFSRKESGSISSQDLKHKHLPDEEFPYTFSGRILESNV